MSKLETYRDVVEQIQGVVDGEPDLIANLANITALLASALPISSWTGFYVDRGSELVLGPFQGKVACVRIAYGKGVCGTSFSERRTVIVPNVHEFPGHIACDAGSNSEIVVPIVAGDRVVAVLDLDSYEYGAYDEVDAAGLANVAAIAATLRW